MTSDFNVRLSNLQSSYETMKNEISQIKKLISLLDKNIEGHISTLSSRINNNNNLHIDNFNKSVLYLDDTSDKIKQDINEFEKTKKHVANVYFETLDNRINLDKIENEVSFIKLELSEKEEKIKQQQQKLSDHTTHVSYCEKVTNETLYNIIEDLRKQKIEISTHGKSLESSQKTHRLTLDNLNLINERLNSICSAIENSQYNFEKKHIQLNDDVKRLEDKLIKYIDARINSLARPPSRFETSPQVLDELKILGINIQNIVIQKNILEVQSKRHEVKIENLTKKLQEMKE